MQMTEEAGKNLVHTPAFPPLYQLVRVLHGHPQPVRKLDSQRGFATAHKSDQNQILPLFHPLIPPQNRILRLLSPVARAVAVMLSDLAPEIIILNRTIERAQKIADEVNAYAERQPVRAMALADWKQLPAGERYLAVQATIPLKAALRPHKCVYRPDPFCQGIQLFQKGHHLALIGRSGQGS